MRIEEIRVDGFGLMHGKTVNPDPGLTVFRGLNEAGKTTLLSFIRSVLFGFDGRTYRAMAGGRRGGWLRVRTRDGRAYRVERYGDAGGQGRLRVLDGDDHDLGSGELAALLQGVDQQLFRNVFAFGLAELAEFKRLTEDQVTARIYGAGLALGTVSPLDVESRLQAERDELFKPGGQNPTINAILRELEAIDVDLRDLDLPARYETSVGELARHDERLAELRGAISEAAGDRRRAERLRSAWESWLVLADAQAARAALDEVTLLPDDLAERLGVRETKADASRRQLDELVARRSDQEDVVGGMTVDATIIASQPAIDDLSRAAERDRERERELESVRDQIRAAERERDDALLRLGASWTVERVAEFDDSVTVQAEISGRFRQRLDRAAAALAQAQSDESQTSRDIAAAREEQARLAAQIGEIAAEEATVPELGIQERLLTALESARADRASAATRAAALAAEADAAAGELRRTEADNAEDLRVARQLRDSLLEERQVAALLESIPSGTAARPWAGRILGPALIVVVGLAAGLLAVANGLPLPGLLLGIGGLVGAWITWTVGARARTSDGTGVRQGLEQRAAAARGSVTGYAVRFGLGPDPTVAVADGILDRCAADAQRLAGVRSRRDAADAAARELDHAEHALLDAAQAAGVSATASADEVGVLRERLEATRDRRSRRLGLQEQAMTLANRLEGLDRLAETNTARLTDAHAVDVVARGEWASWLGDHDLDPSLDRETAKTVIDAVTATKRPLRSLAGLAERQGILLAQHTAFLEQAVDAAMSVGLVRPAPDDRSSADRLVGELENILTCAIATQTAEQREAAKLEELRREEARARSVAEADAASIAAMLEEHAASNVETLREAISLSDRAREFDERIAGCHRTLTALSGPGGAHDVLLAELGAVADAGAITAAQDAAADRLGELESEQSALREEAGALRDQIAGMERDVAATETRQRREDLLGRLTEAAGRWSVAAIGRHVLRQSREAYEAAHRPAVIETAERYFSAWTVGRYTRIVAPLGRQIEAVEHRDGTLVPVGDLSTGTAQQLYLAIRFGLVEHFAEAAEPLPIVMDDILVNFDDERAELAARSIEQLATRHQVIYFTCHPATPLTGGLEIHLDRLDTVAAASVS